MATRRGRAARCYARAAARRAPAAGEAGRARASTAAAASTPALGARALGKRDERRRAGVWRVFRAWRARGDEPDRLDARGEGGGGVAGDVAEQLADMARQVVGDERGAREHVGRNAVLGAQRVHLERALHKRVGVDLALHPNGREQRQPLVAAEARLWKPLIAAKDVAQHVVARVEHLRRAEQLRAHGHEGGDTQRGANAFVQAQLWPVREQVAAHRLLPLNRKGAKPRQQEPLEYVGVTQLEHAERRKQRLRRPRQLRAEEIVRNLGAVGREKGMRLLQDVALPFERDERAFGSGADGLVDGHARERVELLLGEAAGVRLAVESTKRGEGA
eukprot:4714997-Pleurochrysis_carterae.AAC.2